MGPARVYYTASKFVSDMIKRFTLAHIVQMSNHDASVLRGWNIKLESGRSRQTYVTKMYSLQARYCMIAVGLLWECHTVRLGAQKSAIMSYRMHMDIIHAPECLL